MIGVIVGWVIGFFAGVGSAILAALAAIWAALTTVWAAIAALSVRLYEMFARLGEQIYELARSLWDDVLGPLVDTLVGWWDRFIGFLRRVVEPILDRLEWINDLLVRIYDRFVLPVLQWMERARLILAGLGALGVGWAESLSQVLGQLQQQINQRFEQVHNYVYKITQVINDLLAPEGWIKGKVFLKSVYKWHAGMMSIVMGVGIDPDLAARRRARQQLAEIPTLPMIRDRWTNLILHDHPAVQRAVQAFKDGKFKTGEYTGRP